jgi:hypothetical protein
MAAGRASRATHGSSRAIRVISRSRVQPAQATKRVRGAMITGRGVTITVRADAGVRLHTADPLAADAGCIRGPAVAADVVDPSTRLTASANGR